MTFRRRTPANPINRYPHLPNLSKPFCRPGRSDSLRISHRTTRVDQPRAKQNVPKVRIRGCHCGEEEASPRAA